MTENATQAFALRESAPDDLSGATVAAGPNAETIDIVARLKEGKGTIVTDDQSEIDALNGVDLLKSVPVPARAKKTTEQGE